MATAAVALASGAQTNSAMDDEAPQQGGFGQFYKVRGRPAAPSPSAHLSSATMF
eukprot:COSAG04_NODE_3240_length_3016_cov_1.415153_1_plen_54_part_00